MLNPRIITFLTLLYIFFLTTFFYLGYKSIHTKEVAVDELEKKEKVKEPKIIKASLRIISPYFNKEYKIKLTDDYTVLDALNELYDPNEFTYEQLDLISGTVIEEINGIKRNAIHTWNLYINDGLTLISPKDTKLQHNYTYTLKYE